VRRTYRVLLRLYPFDFRAAFAAEMWVSFARADAAPRGVEPIGLLAGAAAEWIAKLTSDKSVRGRALPDLRMMRPAGMPRELWFGRI
jgi:hypothetical protein